MHSLLHVRLSRDSDQTPTLVGIADDHTEWRVRLVDVSPETWTLDVNMGLETLYATACRRNPDLVALAPPRVVPEDERFYLRGADA